MLTVIPNVSGWLPRFRVTVAVVVPVTVTDDPTVDPVLDKVTTVCPDTKFVPVSVITGWVVVIPEFGFRPVNVGACDPPPDVTLKFTDPLVPAPVLTVIPNVSGWLPRFRVTVAVVVPVTVTDDPTVDPVLDKVTTVCPGTKFVPVSVITGWVVVIPEFGFRPVNVGGWVPPPDVVTS